MRLEKNDYAFVLPINPYFWVAKSVNFYNAEAGIGYRLGADTLVKASYRRDLWTVEDDLKPILPDGWAIGVQLSQRFDVLALTNPPR